MLFVCVCKNGNPNEKFTYDPHRHPTVFVSLEVCCCCWCCLWASFINTLSICFFLASFCWWCGKLTLSILCAIRIRTYACQFGVTHGSILVVEFSHHILLTFFFLLPSFPISHLNWHCLYAGACKAIELNLLTEIAHSFHDASWNLEHICVYHISYAVAPCVRSIDEYEIAVTQQRGYRQFH